MSSIVLTVIGPDRPGLVERIAHVVAEHDGNWLESRMSQLAGRFAGIVHVGVPEARRAQLVAALRDLDDLTVVAQESDGAAEQPYEPVGLSVIGNDRPGIVRELAAVLARHDVNVEELSTECRSAPMAGGAMFEALAQLHIPANGSLDALRNDLEAIAVDLMIDLKLG